MEQQHRQGGKQGETKIKKNQKHEAWREQHRSEETRLFTLVKKKERGYTMQTEK